MVALVALIESIEGTGFDIAGILDSRLLARDSSVNLGQAAARTSVGMQRGATFRSILFRIQCPAEETCDGSINR